MHGEHRYTVGALQVVSYCLCGRNVLGQILGQDSASHVESTVQLEEHIVFGGVEDAVSQLLASWEF